MTGNTSKNRIEVAEGDITKQHVDAIVNAANTTLLGGGGVDGAIHRAAGPQLLEECRALGGCPTGQARITSGYKLQAKWVIHTVGPVWRDGNRGEDDLLSSCYRNSLALATSHAIRAIAFPSISTGAYRFPLERATRIAVNESKHFLERNQSVEKVVFVCFGDKAFETYQRVVKDVLAWYNCLDYSRIAVSGMISHLRQGATDSSMILPPPWGS
jgi:O-acetyl-ADP-ribose deacetylase (regulator of RNase III)